ncbi:MAG: chitobiase/beta-hexosaminidase C-terminal domain-containing protein, partial [Methanobrevibacter sp.]|nr:chitobiase/beta-hexosaminidase C-terminal domain-containing protein [Methanobrevibacter sp.]
SPMSFSNVTNVRIDYSYNKSSSAAYQVFVGDTQIGSDCSFSSTLKHAKANFSSATPLSGAISIRVKTRTEGTIWIGAVTVITGSSSKVSTPTFSVAEGTYNESKSVTLSCSTTDATIRYTLDGTTPTSTSTVYSSSITVNATKTIKAKAFKSGLTDSDVASATYTIQCATPTFSVNAGTYNESKSVTLSTTYGTKIYYTTNGSDPTTSSTEYTGAITVSQTTTIKAIAWKSGCSNSEIASRTYTIKCATPTFSVAQGTYTTNQSVELSTTYGDKIYYTTNGNTPTTSSSEYTGAIAVSATTTIKAIAWKEGCNNSSTATATYTLKCDGPTFNVDAGTHHGAQTITISCNTPSVTIRYTTNNSNPSTTTGTIYSEPITVSSSQTVKAIAYKDNWSASTVASATYTIQYKVTWNDNGGQIGEAVWVNSGSTTYTCPSDPAVDERGNCGARFMGWTDAEYTGDNAPTVLFTNSKGTKPAIDGNKNFHAVFADYAD